MSLNTLKWIYTLGVKHERRRIAAFLQETRQHHQRNISRINTRFDGGAVKESDKHDLAVEYSVNQIIDDIFRIETSYTNANSIMYPEGEE